MTDKEMAEQYVKDNCTRWEYDGLSVDDIAKENFLAGLKAGRPEWHKVADGDLPKVFDKPYLCKVYSHFEVGYFTAYKDQPWHFDEYYLDNEDVIAWKEIVLPELPKESE